jgi:hypothetical protein
LRLVLSIPSRAIPFGSKLGSKEAPAQMTLVEDMPLPGNDDEFPHFLVPARNNIQRQLLRLQVLLGRPSAERSRNRLLLWMLGVGFSLWRAVFQSGNSLDVERNLDRARWFLNEIVRNNAAAYGTELNSWSLGYYLSNARFRIVAAYEELPDSLKSVELTNCVTSIKATLKADAKPGPEEWIECFKAMVLLLGLAETL